jgi:hypothetical protein
MTHIDPDAAAGAIEDRIGLLSAARIPAAEHHRGRSKLLEAERTADLFPLVQH